MTPSSAEATLRACKALGAEVPAEPSASEPCFSRFASFGAVAEGWYAVLPATSIRRGDIRRAWIGERDVIVYRALSGELRALDRCCPHLGTDLAHGRVVDKGLRCAFHGWCFGRDGAGPHGCRARTYEIREKWGFAWLWAGEAPAYELPDPAPENRAHVARLPPQTLRCHPHVMLGNGLDVTHVVPVHRFRFEGEPTMCLAPPRLSVAVHARFAPTLMRRLLGLAGRDARWRFTTIGPSLAWVEVEHPTPFELLWTGRPLPGGACAAQTFFFLPRWRSLVRALPMMVATTWADRKVLDNLEFHPGFVPSDAVFATYARLVEELPEWL